MRRPQRAAAPAAGATGWIGQMAKPPSWGEIGKKKTSSMKAVIIEKAKAKTTRPRRRAAHATPPAVAAERRAAAAGAGRGGDALGVGVTVGVAGVP